MCVSSSRHLFRPSCVTKFNVSGNPDPTLNPVADADLNLQPSRITFAERHTCSADRSPVDPSPQRGSNVAAGTRVRRYVGIREDLQNAFLTVSDHLQSRRCRD